MTGKPVREPWFFFAYLYRELRRRLRQGLLIALGLGLGVALVMVVSAASAGAAAAQAVALRSLYGISTGLTVTEPARDPGALQDPHALLTGGLAPLPSSVAASISRLPHVASAAGGLQLTELKPSASGWTPITVDGVDVARPGLGRQASVVSGREFSRADAAANVAVIDGNYATASKLRSQVVVAGTRFKVIGIIRQAQGAGSASIYLPLAAAQRLGRSPAGGHLAGQVNVIYAAAGSASWVAQVQQEISRLMPSATITSNSDLAKAVTGGLQSTASLVRSLGAWLAVASLATAFAVASLLTTAAVARRTREFGTLKALGWTGRRITWQIIGEWVAIGVAGTAIGLAAGFAGTAVINALAPALSATAPRNNGSGQAATVAVRLAAHVSPPIIATAALLAIGGAVLAGALGAWRASRLQPADAFARVT